MRFYDFMADMQQTSERITVRDANLSGAAFAVLVAKTMMRPDVIAYFDSLSAGHAALEAEQKILYYIIMFGFSVNVKPRPSHGTLLSAAEKLVAQLSLLAHGVGEPKVLFSTGTALRPKALFNKISRLLRVKGQSGFYCSYSPSPPDPGVVSRHVSDNFHDASLILFPTDGRALYDLSRADERIVYSGNIYTSPRTCIGGLYIGAIL
jgi:hypothetical protein